MPVGFIPTPGTVRTDIALFNSLGQVHNIYWFQREAAWTQAEREALNTALQTYWTTNLKPLLSANISLAQITSVNQDTANAPASTLVVTPLVAGSVTGSAYPAGTCICCTLRTGLRGRSFRGRSYISGLPVTVRQDDGNATVAFIGNLINALAALKTVITGLGAIWVVVSKYTNKVPRAAGLCTPVTAIAADQSFDSQRRRLVGRGV